MAADVAPGCEQYYEECEDIEFDDDVVFLAAATQCALQFKHKTSGGGGSDFEPNECLSQLGATTGAALAKMKAAWAVQRSNKVAEPERGARHTEFDPLKFVEQLALLKHRWRDSRADAPAFEEAQSDMDSDEDYEPEGILRERCRCKRDHQNQIVKALQCKCRRFEYYVKWVGYDADESTWETAGNIASHPGVMRAWKEKKKARDEGQIKQKRQRQSDQNSDNNKQKKKQKGTVAATDPNPVATEPTVCVLLPGQAWSNCCGAALPETSLNKQKNCKDQSEGSGCSERKAKLGKRKRKPASR